MCRAHLGELRACPETSCVRLHPFWLPLTGCWQAGAGACQLRNSHLPTSAPLSLVTNNCPAPRSEPCQISAATAASGVGGGWRTVPQPLRTRPQQCKPLPELRFHTNILLLKILKAPCDFVKGSILTRDFNEASNVLKGLEQGFHPG